MRQLPLMIFVALCGAASAQDLGDVPLPRARPVIVAPVPLPRPRPVELPSSSSVEVPGPDASSAEPPIPAPEPVGPPAEPKLYQTACPSVLSGQVTAKMLPPIHEGQCGATSPLSLAAISANGRSIPLNAPVITDCGMASALPDWLSAVDSYVAAHDKTRIKTLDVGTGYDCRNVDHAATGNLSDHAFADAIDVIGFSLEDGRKISIAPGFNGTPEQGHDILHFARDAACASFMTVLGPDADAYHQDNLHLDLACHGKACSARLCQ